MPVGDRQALRRFLLALTVTAVLPASEIATADDSGRQAAERQREQTRLRADDAHRRAAAQARVEELARDVARRQARHIKKERRAPKPPDPPLLTLRRNARAELGLDHLPAPRAFRVHYPTGRAASARSASAPSFYLSTIDRSRFTQALGGLPVTIDPLRPYDSIVDVHQSTDCFRPPSGIWRVTP